MVKMLKCLIDKSMVMYCMIAREPIISIVLVYSSDFLIQVCRKLLFVLPAEGVKQSAKVLGSLFFFAVNVGLNGSENSKKKTKNKKKKKHASPTANRRQKFSNFSRIFLPTVLTKVRLGFLTL